MGRCGGGDVAHAPISSARVSYIRNVGIQVSRPPTAELNAFTAPKSRYLRPLGPVQLVSWHETRRLAYDGPGVRGPAWSSILIVGFLLLLTAACGTETPARGSVKTGQHSPAANCGEPTRIARVSSELARGARAGPVWLIMGERGETTATIHLTAKYPSALFPTKVLVYARTQLEADVRLRGWRCSDRRPLRFWYRAGRPGTPRKGFPEARMRKIGDLVATLEAGHPATAYPVIGYTGFFLFSAPGTWTILVEQQYEVVAEVTMRVIARRQG